MLSVVLHFETEKRMRWVVETEPIVRARIVTVHRVGGKKRPKRWSWCLLDDMVFLLRYRKSRIASELELNQPTCTAVSTITAIIPMACMEEAWYSVPESRSTSRSKQRQLSGYKVFSYWMILWNFFRRWIKRGYKCVFPIPHMKLSPSIQYSILC